MQTFTKTLSCPKCLYVTSILAHDCYVSLFLTCEAGHEAGHHSTVLSQAINSPCQSKATRDSMEGSC